jgi:hypothetical protein
LGNFHRTSALPILPEGGIEFVKKFAKEHGGHNKEHDEFTKLLVLLENGYGFNIVLLVVVPQILK